MKIPCNYCGKEITKPKCWVKRQQRHFCSRNCLANSNRKYPKFSCQKCHKEFSAHNKRKFCSLKCVYGNRTNDISEVGKWLPCANCGKKRYWKPSQIEDGKGKFCSIQCRKKRIKINCKTCNKEIEREMCDTDRQFCSKSCYHKSKCETLIERTIKTQLDLIGLHYIQNFPLQKFTCDFYLPDYNLVIECDGDYWHSMERAKLNDARKDRLLLDAGIDIIRLSERKINENLTECVAEILAYTLNKVKTEKMILVNGR